MVIAGIPSRGLVFSRTFESVYQNNPEDIIFSHSLPVPEAYNNLVRQFLLTRATHLWLVDDDMLIPEGTLTSLIEADTDIALSDYPLESGTSVQYDQGEFLFGGLGCVLVKRIVFESGVRFRTSIGYSFPDLRIIERNPNKHGGQDVDFYVQARQKGFETKVVGTVGHLRIPELHKKGNNTQYEVREL